MGRESEGLGREGDATPMGGRLSGRARTGALVFGVALAFRLILLLFTQHPVVDHDQYWYYYGGLSIAQEDNPVAYVLTSDTWRRWQGPWTIAPLYYIFIALVFRIFGAHLVALQIAQCVLGAVSAVLLGLMGEQLAGGAGKWAGIAYALYWPAADLNALVYTENLHTPLLIASFTLLIGRASPRRSFAGGLVLGLSALARSVSSAFVPLAAIARLAGGAKERRTRSAAAALVLGSLVFIAPWLARNVVLGEPPTIETVGVLNLLLDNAYQPRPVYREAGFFYGKKPWRASRQALGFVVRNVTHSPDAFLAKIAAGIPTLPTSCSSAPSRTASSSSSGSRSSPARSTA